MRTILKPSTSRFPTKFVREPDTTFSIEVGTIINGQTVCVGEFGPYRSMTFARIMASQVIGKPVALIPDLDPASGDVQEDDYSDGLIVSGTTMCAYTDEIGTYYRENR